VRIYSNDPKTPDTRLTIKGPVKQFAQISPRRVSMVGPVGVALTRKVIITPEQEYPFKITEHKVQKGEFIKYQLNEKKEADQLNYELVVDNLKTDKGWYSDTIILKTDSAVRPELRIRVNGNLKETNKAETVPKSEVNPKPAKKE
jgi:hypothetical protein